MLYDPKWEKTEVTTDPFSLDSLIAWLETQPAETEYNYTFPGSCMIAQYLEASKVKNFSLSVTDLQRHGWHHIAQGSWGEAGRWTFGGALIRARALAAK